MLFGLLFLTVALARCLSQEQRLAKKDAVGELPAPVIVIDRGDGVLAEGNSARIECRTSSYYTGSTFYLKREGEEKHVEAKAVPDGEDTVTFLLLNLTAQHQGTYRCYYSNQKSGSWRNSTLSNPVQLTIHGIENKWLFIGIGAGGVVVLLILIAAVWCICRKKAESRRKKNDGSNLWTAFDSNIDTPYGENNRRSFRFSRGQDPRMKEEEGSVYTANHSTEFLNDTQFTPRGSQKKPYFITFMEQ
ncbi:CXADR-like membrane protein isoform X2 [Carcharodon carcharias]|uniref:CXADR-like membrane protein isoform X2 n=1 Tax=Carcharodon carcharias TaxID=13397 RepID=UPI001B7DB48C|nr:CXADR-like membrane protein isoform X2 [Carcharodon carcharias]